MEEESPPADSSQDDALDVSARGGGCRFCMTVHSCGRAGGMLFSNHLQSAPQSSLTAITKEQ